MHKRICTMLASLSLALFLIIADVPAAYSTLDHHQMEAAENSETFLNMDGVQNDYLTKKSHDEVLPFPASKDGFQRQRKSDKKQCHILVQKTEMQKGTCTKLADSTPACHNDQYLAINYNEC